MNDTEILNYLESLIECDTARIMFNDDDELYDDWGKIPIGFSIRDRARNEYVVSAQTLRECVLKAKAADEKWVDDEIGKLEDVQ